MVTFKKSVIVIAGLGLVAAPLSTANSTAPQQGPGGARGLIPVAFALCRPEGTAMPKCQAAGVPRVYEVPGGHTLVIEQVSGECGGDGGLGVPFRAGVVAETNGIALAHWIVAITAPDRPGGHIPLTTTTIYGDAGSLVTLDVTEVPAFSGRFRQATFSGQLLKD
jgi:hypothetical protein